MMERVVLVEANRYRVCSGTTLLLVSVTATSGQSTRCMGLPNSRRRAIRPPSSWAMET